MLTYDAFGVLPPISRLTPAQAAYHFLSGYTAKVAGTEVGLGKEPQATFSTCFGAPFMSLHPTVYSKLLSENIAKNGTKVWLMNTGFTGGPFGVGKRMSIQHTRTLLNAALDGALHESKLLTRFEREGGWYAVLRVPATGPDEALAVDLLERCSVLVHPGHFFNFARDGFLVLSLIAPEKQFQEGLRRVREFFGG